MVFYLPKYYLDIVFINLYFVKYYLDSKLGKLPLLCTVTVKMGTSISKLGRVLFHINSCIRSTLLFTKSSALLKMVKKLIFLKENAVFNIELQLYINKTQDSLQLLHILKTFHHLRYLCR